VVVEIDAIIITKNEILMIFKAYFLSLSDNPNVLQNTLKLSILRVFDIPFRIG